MPDALAIAWHWPPAPAVAQAVNPNVPVIAFIAGFDDPRPSQAMRRPATSPIRFDEEFMNHLSTHKLNNKAEYGRFGYGGCTFFGWAVSRVKCNGC